MNAIVKQSAVLRGQGQFQAAIDLIENNISGIGPDLHVNAWLEAFYAAIELGDTDLIKKYAQLVAIEDPDVPSVQAYI